MLQGLSWCYHTELPWMFCAFPTSEASTHISTQGAARKEDAWGDYLVELELATCFRPSLEDNFCYYFPQAGQDCVALCCIGSFFHVFHFAGPADLLSLNSDGCGQHTVSHPLQSPGCLYEYVFCRNSRHYLNSMRLKDEYFLGALYPLC